MQSVKALIPATALAILYSCTPAWADTPLESRSVTVHFGDLNINSASGAERLYQRIARAAEDVCGDNSASQRLLMYSSRYATCVRSAIGAAVARVNHPEVTAYAVARGIVPALVPIKGKLARND
jgi:UrcA family protein